MTNLIMFSSWRKREPEYQKSYAGYRTEDEDDEIIQYILKYFRNEYNKD